MRANKNKRQRSLGSWLALSHLSHGYPWVPGPRSCWSVRRKGWWKIESLHLGVFCISTAAASGPRTHMIAHIGFIQNLDAPYFMTIWVEKVMIVPFGGTLFPTNPAIHRCFENVKFKRPHRPHPAVLVWTQVGQGLRSHIRLSVEITNDVHNNRPSQNCSLRNWVYPDWDGFNNHHQTRTEQNSELRTQNSELRTQNSELRTQNINILYYIILYYILCYVILL